MDVDNEPKPRSKRKRALIVAALILIIAAIIFVGFNIFYVVDYS